MRPAVRPLIQITTLVAAILTCAPGTAALATNTAAPAKGTAVPAGGAPNTGAVAPNSPSVAILATLDVPDSAMILHFTNIPVEKIIKAVAQLNHFQFETAGDFVTGRRVTVDWQGVPMKQALAAIADELGLRYEVVQGKRLVVHDAKKAAK